MRASTKSLCLALLTALAAAESEESMMLQMQGDVARKGEGDVNMHSDNEATVGGTLKGLNARMGHTQDTFGSISSRLADDAKVLAQEFEKGRNQLALFQEEKTQLEETMTQDKNKLLGELDDFKRRTLEKLAELQATDQKLESENEQLTQENAQLGSDLDSEQNMKGLLMKKLHKMAALFKHQSTSVRDMVSQHESSLATQVSTDLEEVLQAVGHNDEGANDDVNVAALLQELGIPASAGDLSASTASAKLETTTLVLR